MQYLDGKIGVYIVGGEPTKEYLDLRESFQLKNLHFLGYKNKQELKEIYLAADIFVHPTKEDVWGLVVNEALAYGLPVVTTDRCIAGQELVKDGINGYIVDAGSDGELSKAIENALCNQERMGIQSLIVIQNYTIENMVADHLKVMNRE